MADRKGTLTFDGVVVTSGGESVRLTVDEFLALPLSVRVKHLIARSATFLKDGEEFDRQLALTQLRLRRTTE